MQFDPHWVFFFLVFATVFSFGQAAWGLVGVGRARAAVNKRLATAERTGSLGDLVLELRKQRGFREDGRSIFNWSWFADLILRSGVTVDIRRWAMVVAGCWVGAAAVAFYFSHNIFIALAAGVVMAVGGPIAFLQYKAGARTKALSLQLPQALEVMVRSLEAGHPIPTSINLVGRELPDPIGTEFGMAADEIAFGATLEQAVARVADRCRHADVDLFAAAIRLQEKAGGNLTGLLKMLARTVRERHKMRLKIRAASSEGRMSAYILTAAPICCFIFVNVSQPHYYGDLLNVRFVQYGLAGLCALLVTGNLVMKRMIDMRI
ncbi:MAG TPA: type II secretion system F family protein [Caulobacteraceae bacterium]|jgi:tight adherence protein B|nr:type II secretion system F family protein [Caulobacteraceae bacterium]